MVRLDYMQVGKKVPCVGDVSTSGGSGSFGKALDWENSCSGVVGEE